MMGMGMQLRITQRLRCDCCKQVVDEDRAREDAWEAAWFGFVAYAVCPDCGQKVPEPWSKAYRKRWDKRVAEIRKEKETQP